MNSLLKNNKQKAHKFVNKKIFNSINKLFPKILSNSLFELIKFMYQEDEDTPIFYDEFIPSRLTPQSNKYLLDLCLVDGYNGVVYRI